MTELEYLSLENDLMYWVENNFPGQIERKFVELIQSRLSQDKFLVIWSRYLSGKGNPSLKTYSRDGLEWNVIGTQWLAGLLSATIEMIHASPSTTSIQSQDSDDEVTITKI